MPKIKTIMVVDDEAGIRDLLFDILSGEGFEVTLAKNGKDSLKQMKNHRYDLVITDMNMPGLDGLGLLKRMKRAGRREKIIVMTGDPFDQSDFEKEIPPIYMQLKKPFHMTQFLEVVTSVLRKADKENRPVRSERKQKRALNAV